MIAFRQPFTCAALICLAFGFGACAHPQAGSVRAKETRHPDGAVSRVVEYIAPANASEASSVSLRLPEGTFGSGDNWADAIPPALGENDAPAWIAIDANFGGGFAPEPQGRVDGQRILYGGAVLCVLLGLALGYFGEHFKLMGLSFGAGAGLAGLAMLIDRFPVQTALFIGIGIVAFAVLVGWLFWREYKASGKPQRDRLHASSANPSTAQAS